MKTIAELKAIASAATPGEWQVCTSNSVRRVTSPGKQDGGVLSAVTTRDGMPDLHGNNRDADLAHISAFSPSTCLELLARLEAMEAQLGSISYTVNGWNNGNRSAETAMHAIAGTLESTP